MEIHEYWITAGLYGTIWTAAVYSKVFQSLHELDDAAGAESTYSLEKDNALSPAAETTTAMASNTKLYSASHRSASLIEGCAVGPGEGRLVRSTPFATGDDVVGTLVGRLLGNWLGETVGIAVGTIVGT
jgi:hypothetical protein